MKFIDLAVQQTAIRTEIDRRIAEVLAHGQYILGPEVAELEARLSEYTGASNCITVSSGTEALLISLMALGIGPGDEVITTPFTFIATAEVIVLLGATPVFIDVEQATGNMNVSALESAITPRTKAVIPVSLYGQPADMDEIISIADRNGKIPVIEDAAQSFGATYKGRKSCNLARVGCTSFFPTKPLGCYGDGGAIFTNDDELGRIIREIRVHGQSERYVHTRVGVGGRMDTLQAAIVLAKLGRFPWEVGQRESVGGRYNELFDDVGIRRIRQCADRTSVFAQYTILLDDRARVQEELQIAGIPTMVHYPLPVNDQPAYKVFERAGRTPVAETMAKQVLSLPMGPDLGCDDQERIVELVAKCSL